MPKWPTSSVNGAYFSPDGKEIFVVGNDGSVKVWSADTTLEKPHFWNEAIVRSAWFNPMTPRSVEREA